MCNEFKPKSVLDPMIGWGARALGTMLVDVPRYVGIDLQEKSVNGVRQIHQDIQSLSKTECYVYHGDALEIMKRFENEFDLIIAGPPYYKVENYNGVVPSSSTLIDWENVFVDPFCSLLSKVLKKRGILALHVFDTHKHTFIETFLEYCKNYNLNYQGPIIYGNVSTHEKTRKQYIHIFKK